MSRPRAGYHDCTGAGTPGSQSHIQSQLATAVFSVVSTQVSCIKLKIMNAIREKRNEFDFMGEIVKLIPAVGIFITMNPGYAGRTGQNRSATGRARVQLRRFRCAPCAQACSSMRIDACRPAAESTTES